MVHSTDNQHKDKCSYFAKSIQHFEHRSKSMEDLRESISKGARDVILLSRNPKIITEIPHDHRISFQTHPVKVPSLVAHFSDDCTDSTSSSMLERIMGDLQRRVED